MLQSQTILCITKETLICLSSLFTFSMSQTLQLFFLQLNLYLTLFHPAQETYKALLMSSPPPFFYLHFFFPLLLALSIPHHEALMLALHKSSS